MPHFLRLARLALALGSACLAPASGQTIRNGTFWKDTSGAPVFSQGGGMLKIGDRYYWYGVKYAEAASYATAPAVPAPSPHFAAVTAYSSTDLVNWTFEGVRSVDMQRLPMTAQKLFQ